MAVAALVAYTRLCSPMASAVRHLEVQEQFARRLKHVGPKVALGCKLWRRAFGKCNRRVLDGLQWWAQDGTGLQVAARCFWDAHLQIARRVITVGSRRH